MYIPEATIECFDLNLPQMPSRLNYDEEFAEILKRKKKYYIILNIYGLV